MSASDTDILSQLQSLKPTGLPAYQAPDTSGLDAQIGQGQQAAAGDEQALEAADTGKADLAAQTAGQLQGDDAKMEQLFQQYPAREVAYGAAMKAAPLIGLLATLGGKAAGISGQGMLGGLTGMMEGLNQGAEDKYQDGLTKWKQQLQTLKDRHEEQIEIYKLMLDAYSGRADAAQKARDFALSATHDAMDAKEAKVKDSIDIWKARSQAINQADRVTALLEGAALRSKAATGGYSPEAQSLDSALADAGVALQGGSRSGPAYFARLDAIMKQHPGESAQQVAQGIKTGKISAAEAQKEGTTAAGIVGKTAVGENEIAAMAPSAIKASEALPRGQWVPANQVIQKVQKGSSDVRLKELAQRTTAILNAYDVVAARGGTDKEKREENRQNLLTADSPEAYKKAVEVMQDEARLAKGAGRQAEAEAAGGGGGAGTAIRKTIGGKTYEQRDGQWYEVQ